MKAGQMLAATHALYAASGILLEGYSRTVGMLRDGSERPSFARDLAAPPRWLNPGLFSWRSTFGRNDNC